jgi:predicted GIY-YIG superfamily endonuclease
MNHLYFIQDQQSLEIKIGRTKDLNRRLREIRTGTNRKYKLLHGFKNYGYVEKELHQHLAAFHVQYEWFKETCLPYAYNYLNLHGISHSMIESSVTAVCDFKRWNPTEKPELFEIIKLFLILSVSFGKEWTLNEIERVFKLSNIDSIDLVLQIQKKDQVQPVIFWIAELIKEDELKNDFICVQDIYEKPLFDLTSILSISKPLPINSAIQRSLHELQYQICLLIDDLINPSGQVSLF